MRSTTWLLAIAPLATASCLATGEGDDEDGEGAFSISVSAADTVAVLDLVNYPRIDVRTLDLDAALDARAAAAIVAYRDGGDAIATTTDDNRFDSLAELDAVKWVGDAALTRLLAFAKVHPVPPSVTVETVAFQGWQAEAVVWGVNQATLAELDDGLDARAANNLYAGRPYASLDSIAAVPYVGSAVLRGLRAESPLWWRKMVAAPAPCTVGVTLRTDGTATTLTNLLEVATMLDWPFAEVAALAAPACVDIDDPAQRAALVAAIADSRGINWGYSPFVRPSAGDFTPGGPRFTAMIGDIEVVIDDRVAEGRWVPTGDDVALYASLPAMVTALTAGAAAHPADFAELGLMIDAEECSQHATALYQRSTGWIWVAHTYPGC